MEERDYSIGEDAFHFFFSLVGVFNHYAFFTEKLWKKVDGFKNKDEAEVKCAFMSLWTYNTLGITTYPAGASWCSFNGDQDSFNHYIGEWLPLFIAFEEWENKQR